MVGPARPDDDRGHARIGQEPAQRERRRIAHLLQLLEAVEDLVGAQVLVRLRAHASCASLPAPRAAAVLPREPAAGERAERLEAEAALRAQRKHVASTSRSSSEYEFCTQANEPAGDRLGSSVASTLESPYAPIFPAATSSSSAPAVSAIGTSSSHACVMKRSTRSTPSRSRLLSTCRLTRAGASPWSAPSDIGVNVFVERTSPFGTPRPDPLADVRLAAAAAVGVRRVERRDAGLPGGVHDVEGLLHRLALSEERLRRPHCRRSSRSRG